MWDQHGKTSKALIISNLLVISSKNMNQSTKLYAHCIRFKSERVDDGWKK